MNNKAAWWIRCDIQRRIRRDKQALFFRWELLTSYSPDTLLYRTTHWACVSDLLFYIFKGHAERIISELVFQTIAILLLQTRQTKPILWIVHAHINLYWRDFDKHTVATFKFAHSLSILNLQISSIIDLLLLRNFWERGKLTTFNVKL